MAGSNGADGLYLTRRRLTMFRKFFTALADLSAAVETLAASVRAANDNFRARLGLDEDNQPEQLEHEPAAARGRKKTS
jgi:hypothetical protein